MSGPAPGEGGWGSPVQKVSGDPEIRGAGALASSQSAYLRAGDVHSTHARIVLLIAPVG
jgi:hypothetical protein